MAESGRDASVWNGAGRGIRSAGPSPSPGRHEKSLGLLTTRFVSLLQEAKDGVLDLKQAADILACFKGDTLLAIQAPSGTQLEVPIPELGPNGQKKYQINLKSQSGPIHVLLINKESNCSKPVVFPVPPPDDLMQPQQDIAIPSFPEKFSSTPLLSERVVSLKEPYLVQAPLSKQTSDCGLQLPAIASDTPYSNMADPPEICNGITTESLQNIREQNGLQSLLPIDVGGILKHPPTSYEQTKTVDSSGTIDGDIMDEFMSSDAFPLLRLSPPPVDEYSFNLDENEGVCDLFDVQIFELPVLTSVTTIPRY
ncbi:hypothetical protein scyTo_0001871 [Scyliorhinus torazame]|uniref:E2F transcription factor CC-MB domain-containing protein n=1 Tax=Scyliorhinus torazame TaxID=75743 RepID=A0A401PGH9_SCYTO|nr:hypothetical protein [Scyliorhinus torazame]